MEHCGRRCLRRIRQHTACRCLAPGSRETEEQPSRGYREGQEIAVTGQLLHETIVRLRAAVVLERQVEELYERIQLPESWVTRLREELQTEMATRSSRNATERTSLVTQLQRVESERRKLLDAYYAGAVDVVTLRREQERINGEARRLQERLSQADASLDEWQAVLDIAIRFASDCAAAYRRADHKTRALFNQAVFEQLLVRDGRVAEARYLAPFDLLFTRPEFEYHDLVGGAGIEPAAFSV